MSLPPVQKSRNEAIQPSPGNIDKSELRRMLLKARLGLDDATRSQWDAAISARLLDLLRERPVASLGVFWPIRNEPDLRALYGELARQGMRLALPLVVSKDSPLEFAAWKPGDEMVPEAMDILVPLRKERVAMPQALLAPCVGFNAERYRLGYGGGFFDRTLAANPQRPFAIGIAYSVQQTEFPVESFDIPLDCVITENGMIR